jgi:hypothetical protein
MVPKYSMGQNKRFFLFKIIFDQKDMNTNVNIELTTAKNCLRYKSRSGEKPRTLL